MFESSKNKMNIATGIGDYYLYVLAGIGVPANALAIVTILTMQAMTPATFFVAALSASDGLALIFKLVFNKMLIPNDTWCKMEFLPVFLTTMANWMLVFICVERFISVCFPLKKAYLVTKSKSYIAVGCTGIILFVPLAALFTIMKTKWKPCGIYEEYFYFWQNIWLYALGNSITVYLPFLFIFIFTAAIIRGLRVSSRDRRSLLRKDDSQPRSNNKSLSPNERQIAEGEKLERTITIMMTFTAVFFLVFSLPSCVFNCLTVPVGASEYADYELFKQIQYLLLDSTHALNFFLYVLTAKRFRGHLVKLLTFKRLRKYFRRRREAKENKHRQSMSNTQTTNVEHTTTHDK